jgi:hypothetical protein
VRKVLYVHMHVLRASMNPQATQRGPDEELTPMRAMIPTTKSLGLIDHSFCTSTQSHHVSQFPPFSCQMHRCPEDLRCGAPMTHT